MDFCVIFYEYWEEQHNKQQQKILTSSYLGCPQGLHSPTVKNTFLTSKQEKVSHLLQLFGWHI